MFCKKDGYTALLVQLSNLYHLLCQEPRLLQLLVFLTLACIRFTQNSIRFVIAFNHLREIEHRLVFFTTISLSSASNRSWLSESAKDPESKLSKHIAAWSTIVSNAGCLLKHFPYIKKHSQIILLYFSSPQGVLHSAHHSNNYPMRMLTSLRAPSY